MRVLITGFTGFIGSSITRYLSKAGFELIGLSRKISASLTPAIQQVQADLRSPAFVTSVQDCIAPCQAIVHAAASLEGNTYAPELTLTNCTGLQSLLDLAQRWGTKKFIYLSSLPVIGIPRSIPITEDHPTEPLTAYHASKLFGENLVRIASLGSAREWVVFRLTAPVGPGMPADRILSVFVSNCLAGKPLSLMGKGTRRQNYIDVRDIAPAVETCLRKRINGLFNLGGHHAISNFELAERCVSLLNSRSQIVFTGRPDNEEGFIWEVSIKKAQSAFDYNPCHSVEDSITALKTEYENTPCQ